MELKELIAKYKKQAEHNHVIFYGDVIKDLEEIVKAPEAGEVKEAMKPEKPCGRCGNAKIITAWDCMYRCIHNGLGKDDLFIKE